MVKQGLNSAELAKRSQLKASFIYDVLSGKSANPSTVKLAKVAETLGINLAYLVGSLRENSPPSSTQDQDEYISIPSISSRMHIIDVAPPQRFHLEWIRQTLGANPSTLRFFTVQEDSMAPTLCQNDMVLIDTSLTQPTPPGIFALHDGIGIILKRMERVQKASQGILRVLSDNAHYAPYERTPEEIRIAGRVIWFARKL